MITGCGSSGFLSSNPAGNTAATPVFTPPAGSYTGTQSIAITDATPASVIYYTTDGSVPTATSPAYSGPISVSASKTLRALASAVGYTSSSVVNAAYVITPVQAIAPVFTPGPGTYATAQSVALSDVTTGAAIYYTTDGTVPTATSTLYSLPIAVSSSEVITAIAIAPGFGNSTAASASYVIVPPIAATPVFSPVPGNYTSSQTVTILDGTIGAKIYYTTDGTVPTAASTLYTQPLIVSSNETISAIAIAAGHTNSLVAQGAYVFTKAQLSAPTFTPAAGTYTTAQSVALSDVTPAAAIYYTTDGSTPTTASKLYSGQILVASNETLTAIAVLNGYTTSAPVAAAYVINGSAAAFKFKNVQIVGGGFVTGIVMHPAQQGLMYARTDVGGAYRRTSTQTGWIPLMDFLSRDLSNYMGVESIGIDPSDPNKLYLAVGTYAESFGSHGAILVSNDQGNTFTTVPMPFKMGANDNGRFAGERLSVDPNLGSHLYLGTRLNGLWESTNSGATWAQSTTFPVQGLASANPASTGGVIFEDFIKSSGTTGSTTPTVYAGVDDSTVAALYLTTDGGGTWTPVPGQPTGSFLNRGEFGPDGNLYLSYSSSLGPAGAVAGSIWRYTPPAAGTNTGTWTNITPIPTFQSNPGTFGYGSVGVDPQRPGVLMATTLDLYYLHDDVFRSLDGGNSWIDLGGNQLRNDALSPWLNFGATAPGIGNWLVSIAIDPYDSKHVLYGTGQTIWETKAATGADATLTTAGTTTAGVVPTTWSVGAQGLEETVIRALISPATGPPLLSGMRDIGGFTHTVLDASPAAGMSTNPLLTDTTGLDWAQAQPSTIVRVGDQGASQFGAYSTDSGNSWTPFANNAGSTAGGGTVALSADGRTIIWAPEDSGQSYSVDFGSTWKASIGAPPQQAIVADRVNPKKFYVFAQASSSGPSSLYRSVDGGATFSAVNMVHPTTGILRASFAAEGDLWLVTYAGVFHSTDSGTTFQAVAGPSEGYDIAFGKAATGSTYPSIYLYGRIAGVPGVYISQDLAVTWSPVTDATHQYGYIDVIAADPNIFGRVYLGTSGRGIIYTDPGP
ncbi:MAG TPA: chitobiase/beta-hexosaminidase C-terminal domain-containing protein [Acidisarcina sp.]